MTTQATGKSLGLLLCLQCHATVRALNVRYPRCPRCHAHLFQRKPHSLGVTAALLIKLCMASGATRVPYVEGAHRGVTLQAK
ncbi:MAG: hypothetical protein ACLPWG_11945, partial [Steroidobacteraceae bacterium]